MHSRIKKNITTLTLLACISTGLRAQQPFVLKGEITAPKTAYLYLRYVDEGGGLKTDSAKIEQNKFVFKGNIKEPILAFLNADPNPEDFDRADLLRFYLEPKTMSIRLMSGKFAEAEVRGSKSQDEWVALNRETDVVRKEREALDKEYESKSQQLREVNNQIKILEAKADKHREDLAEFKKNFAPYNKRVSQINLDFIKNHPDSYISPYLMQFMVSGANLDELEMLYSGLSKNIQNSNIGLEIARKIKGIKGGSAGSKAYTFSSHDITGETLALTDYKGRYVLLDFWASWCIPCRKGNPHLVSLHNQYKDKGFEIIGIADDDTNPKAWHKAVEQDQIHIWKHVLNGQKYENGKFDRSNAIAEHFGISSLPTKILIDPQGIIIGRYSGGVEDDAAMDRKLKEIFNP